MSTRTFAASTERATRRPGRHYRGERPWTDDFERTVDVGTRIRIALPHLLPAVCDQLVTVRIPKVTAVEAAGAAGTR